MRAGPQQKISMRVTRNECAASPPAGLLSDLMPAKNICLTNAPDALLTSGCLGPAGERVIFVINLPGKYSTATAGGEHKDSEVISILLAKKRT